MANIKMFFMILSCLLCLAQTQKAQGNVWDMLINDENLVELPSNNPAPISYGPPARAPQVSYQPYPVLSTSNVGVALGVGGSFAPANLIKPKVEILKLVESFIRLKTEVASRLYALAVDNWETITYLFNALVNNIGTLSAFTVNGIIILRKVLETAAKLFGSWEITVPNVNVDFSTLLRESDLFNVN